MNKFTSTLLTTLGSVLLVLILVGAGFYIATTRSNNVSTYKIESINTDTATGTASNIEAGSVPFSLSGSQKQALVTFGIDPNTIPSSITVEQEACLIANLGSARFIEIKNGVVPNGVDFLKAKSCI